MLSKTALGLFLACVLLLANGGPAHGQAATPASAAVPGSATAMQFPTPNASAAATPPLFTPATPAAAPEPAAAAVPPAPAAAAATPTPAAAIPTPAAPAPAPTAPAAQQPPQEAIPAGPAGTYNLNPFNTIVSCVPFNILVSPSSDNTTYSVTTALNAQVDAALRFRVQNQTLYVGFNRSFDSPEVIKVNITMPASQLWSVTNYGLGDVYLNPGFSTDNTTLLARGTGRLFARGLNTTALNITSSGAADVFAKGNIATANVSADGTGRVTVAGVQKAVNGQLSGITYLFVGGASEDVAIDVDAQGISKVHYTNGTCSAGKQVSVDVPFFSMNLGLSGCVHVQPKAFPRYKAVWSCGMSVQGSSICIPGAAEAAAAAAQGADISVQTQSSAGTAAAAASSTPSSAAATSASANAAPQTTNATPQTVSLLQDQQATTAAAPQDAATAASAADVSIMPDTTSPPAAGRRRLLKFFELPTITLPSLPPLPLLTSSASSSSSSSNDDGNHNTVVVTVGRDGSQTTQGNSQDQFGTVKITTVKCSAQQADLYVPAH